jgi:hypothetical protein
VISPAEGLLRNRTARWEFKRKSLCYDKANDRSLRTDNADAQTLLTVLTQSARNEILSDGPHTA